MAPIMEADTTAITGTSEAGMWPVSPWTSMVANQLQPGQLWRLRAGGVLTSAASSPGTLVVTPRWGTTSSGVSLGASAASATLTANVTNAPWDLNAMLLCRTIGGTGVAVLIGRFTCDQVGVSLNFGGPATTIDTTTPQGIWIGATMGAAGDTLTSRIVALWAEN